MVLEPGGPSLHEHPTESAGRPGARAPHVFLDRDGTRLSTLDLFGRSFVLLAGPEGAAWPAATLAVADRLGVGLDAHVVGEPGWPTRRAASPGRTGSRRPGPCWCDRDGFVGWRVAEAARTGSQQALQTLLCRGDGRP